MTILLLLLACATTSDSSSEDTGYYDWGTPENPDKDGDNFIPGGGDCNDTDPTINEGATETPYDGIDQDCDGADLTDVDGDGYTGGNDGSGEDCNDTDPSFHPNPSGVSREDRAVDSWEECIDRDCDGKVFHAAWEGSWLHIYNTPSRPSLWIYSDSGELLFEAVMEGNNGGNGIYQVEVPLDLHRDDLTFFLQVSDLQTPERFTVDALQWGAVPTRALSDQIEGTLFQDAYKISDPTTWACQ